MPITTSDGYRYEPVLTASAEPPYPPQLVIRSKQLLVATLELLHMHPARKSLSQSVQARYPVFSERAEVASKIIGVSAGDLLTANLCYDFSMGSNLMGCSTLALSGSTGPVLARNMDWFPESKVARASCLITEPFGINAGFLGMLGIVTGLSKAGFALCLNASLGGFDPKGFPMLLFLRHVFDTAQGYHQALEMITGEHLMSGGIITLVGRTNDERVIVERLPKRAAIRTPKDDRPLIATNHFRMLSDPVECSRYDDLDLHAVRRTPLESLTSPMVRQSITTQHIVMCPNTHTAEMYVPTHLLSENYRDELNMSELMDLFTT